MSLVPVAYRKHTTRYQSASGPETTLIRFERLSFVPVT
jgi:hypothetical protein